MSEEGTISSSCSLSCTKPFHSQHDYQCDMILANWHLLSHTQLHGIQYSQWDRQVFSILLSPCQRHGESWVYRLALDFIYDVDLELIVIHCRKEEFAKSGKMHDQRINRFLWQKEFCLSEEQVDGYSILFFKLIC